MEVWCTQIKFAFRGRCNGCVRHAGCYPRCSPTRARERARTSSRRIVGTHLCRHLRGCLKNEAREVLRTPKLYFFFPLSLSLSPRPLTRQTLVTLPRLFLFPSSSVSLLLRLRHLFTTCSATLPISSRTHTAFWSRLFFFPFTLELTAYFSPPKWLRSTRQFSSYRRSLALYPSPLVAFCFHHRSPSTSWMSFGVNASMHQPHVNFIVTVRVLDQRGLTCNYRLATALFLH